MIGALRSAGLAGEDAIRATADWSSLTIRQVRDAIGYYNEYQVEIDARIRQGDEEADVAEQRWREQNLTG